jgi:hypothetical protein
LRADRLDRTLSGIEAGRPSVASALDPHCRSIQRIAFKEVLMIRTVVNAKAQPQSDDRRRQAKRQRGNGEVRRLAVVQPGISHFKLLAVGTSLAATGR